MLLKNSASLRDFCEESLHLQILIHFKKFCESLFTVVIKVLSIQGVSYWTGSVSFHWNKSVSIQWTTVHLQYPATQLECVLGVRDYYTLAYVSTYVLRRKITSLQTCCVSAYHPHFI